MARYLFTTILFVGVYFAVGLTGLTFAEQTQQVSVVWPATGVAIAVLLIFGARYWPGILIGAFLVNVMSNEPPFAALGIAIGNTLESVVAVLLLRSWNFDNSLGRLKEAVKYIAAAVFFGPAISASFGVFSLGLAGIVDFQKYLSVWIVWFVGDAMGALVIAPLILALKEKKYRRLFWQKPREAIVTVLIMVAVSAFIFTRQGFDQLVISQLK